MKKDGRLHDRKTQETIRLMAVERMLEGESVAPVMDSYGCKGEVEANEC
jgi:hypothetical protein